MHEEAGDRPLRNWARAEDGEAKNGADRRKARDEQADPGGVHGDAEVFGEGRDREEGNEIELDGKSEILPPADRLRRLRTTSIEQANDAERESDPGQRFVAIAVDHELVGAVGLPEWQAAVPVGGEFGAVVEIPAECEEQRDGAAGTASFRQTLVRRLRRAM